LQFFNNLILCNYKLSVPPLSLLSILIWQQEVNLILVDQEVEEDLAALAALVIEVEEVTTRDQLEGVVVNLNFQV